MSLAPITLDDKYTRTQGRVFLTGIQALTRLVLDQKRRDSANGLNTAGFISGYRGSPLGGFDKSLWAAKAHLDAANIRFQPGVNEDLAATAVWGSQQVNLFPEAKYDGVFGVWYGKGPGVDRSGDVFKHANSAGTSPFGGVLALAGDDHTCKSSTIPHQSEYAFIDAQMPVLNPSGVGEILELGAYGFALSRFSGCWVGFKTIAETVDSSASVDLPDGEFPINIPTDFEMPEGGLHIRWPDKPLEQELRLQRHKLYAALAFARINPLNRIVLDSPQPRLGIATAGKSYLDVRQALSDLGIDDALAKEIGLRIYKVGMTWPLERDGVRDFAAGLEEILVVEEKRAVIENQLKEQLYNWDPATRPRVIGKFDEHGGWILPSANEITPARIARVIAERVARFFVSEKIQSRLAFLEAKEHALDRTRTNIERTPHFCSGCPHNTSTRVPKDSRALAGIGCHYMATWMDRSTETFSQMGGEGAAWIGQSAFTNTPHVFANIGDGTYFHSGLLAIRAAVAAKVNITYKLLYNDAVAMTGGQPMDGQLSVTGAARQMLAEGVKRVVVVTDEPEFYSRMPNLPAQVQVHHRDRLNQLQLELRESQGVTAIIYAQICATELRRRRKRGTVANKSIRVFINSEICEGCGDCATQSNCLSVVPLETELGRKRSIDQSACNIDLSCVKGLCPSFVTVSGGELRKPSHSDKPWSLPEPRSPTLPQVDTPYGMVITGVGGTGVVTIGALLGMAAHIDGCACSVLDMTGLAQKFGAVVSHVRIATRSDDIHAVRVAAGGADLLLGCDEVVAGGFDALSKSDREKTRAVINTHEAATSGLIANPDLEFPAGPLEAAIRSTCRDDGAFFVAAQELASALMGDAIATNLFMVGFAWQKGLVPISKEAIESAIHLNKVAVTLNLAAFKWGRRAASDMGAVRAFAGLAKEADPVRSTDLDDIIAAREERLIDYQNAAYAQRYARLVKSVREAEHSRTPGKTGLTTAAAESYFKLLAYKDEYEVARLLSAESFNEDLAAAMSGDFRVSYHLSPPILSSVDPLTDRPEKQAYGSWMLPALRGLAALKFLRGTRLDPFGRTAERRLERKLITDFEHSVQVVVDGLDLENHATAVEILGLPLRMRGFGSVKSAAVDAAVQRREELMAAYQTTPKRIRTA